MMTSHLRNSNFKAGLVLLWTENATSYNTAFVRTYNTGSRTGAGTLYEV